MSSLFRLLCFLLLPLALGAAPFERDLNHGLGYVRLRTLPGDLPPQPSGRVPPCVVDLRYLGTDAEGAAAFSEWLKARAILRSPVFVLVNGDTSPALLRLLARRDASAAVLTIGVPHGDFQPDVVVKTSPEDERRAYEAMEKGASIATLLTDNPEKVRNDEASLSKDRLAEASAEAADDALAGKRPAPPIDAALQRAVHLHRALLALKKL